ncbi:MAG: hypothetical protein WCT99_09985 [Bacteroidota bacterium]|jgi:A/G-specific adenine glycosylase
MLQQTQASRVVEFYSRWVKKFPSIAHLAAAPSSEVLRCWSGLGYNSRALRLHAAAKTTASSRNKKLPSDPAELQLLPGIGKYTANAVACFAFKKNVPVVDVNIRRILTRLTVRVRSSAEMIDEKRAWQYAEQLLPRRSAYTWNQSLMDLGSQICTARRPGCAECPVSSLCRSAFAPCFVKNEKREKKKEPQWRGIPRRLIRGKILAFLHGQEATIEEIAAMLWGKVHGRDVAWLEGVLERMMQEGFIARTKKRYRVA